MKLREQNCGEGPPAESHRATKGLLWENASEVEASELGVGSIRSVRTTPCLHDRTSVASPLAGIAQTFKHKNKLINM
jgi:hypothetical protein